MGTKLIELPSTSLTKYVVIAVFNNIVDAEFSTDSYSVYRI